MGKGPTGTIVGGNLSPNASQMASIGQCLVDIGGGVWLPYPQATTYLGCVIGLAVTNAVPGGGIRVLVTGEFPQSAFNIGSGAAGTVVAGTTPSRGYTGQVIGTCNTSGSITMWPSYVGVPAQQNAQTIGILGGIALNTTPPTVGQAPVFDGTRWTFMSVAGGGFPTGTGIVYVTSGSVNPSAVDLTQDVSQGALSGTSLPITVTGLQTRPVSSSAPSTGNTLGWNGSDWTPSALNLAGGTNYVTGNLPITNLAPGANDTLFGTSHTGATEWFAPGGDVSLLSNSFTVTGLQTHPVASAAPTEGQFLIQGALNWAPTSLSGDVSASVSTPGKLEVTGLLDTSLPSLPGSAGSYALVYTESSGLYSWTNTSTFGSTVTWAGDLGGGSTNSAQYVQSLSGPGATGTAVALNTVGLQFAANIAAPTISQAQLSGTGATASQTLKLVAQPGQNVASGTNNNGGILLLQSGAAGTGGTGGGPGAIQFYTGAAEALQLDTTTYGGYTHFYSPQGLYFNATGAIYFVSNAPNIYMVGPLQIQDPNNGDPVWTWSATYNAQATQTASATVAGVLISQATQTSDVATHDLTISSQGPYGSASTNKSPGRVVLNTPAPVTGGNHGYVIVTDGGTGQAAIGSYAAVAGGSTNYAAIWLAPSLSPSSTDFLFLSNAGGTAVDLNVAASGALNFTVTGTSAHGLTMNTNSSSQATSFVPAEDVITSAGLTTNRWSQVLAGSNGFQVYSGGSGSASADPTSTLGSASLTFGSGTAAADLRLYRSGASIAYLDNGSGGNAALNVGGGSSGSQLVITSSTTSFDVTSASSQKSLNLGTGNATSVVMGNTANATTIASSVKGTGTATWNFGGAVSHTFELANGGLNPEILFTDPSGVSGNSGGVALGFTGVNGTGVGMTIGVFGQSANASGGAGGGVTLTTGQGAGGSADGNITFAFNVSGPGGTVTDQVQFMGATSSRDRGTLKWSSALTPILTQATAATGVVPNVFTITPQGPNSGSTTQAANTPGGLTVNFAAPGTSGTAGLHAQFLISDAFASQCFIACGGSVTGGSATTSCLWLGAGTSGISSGSTNYTLKCDTSNVSINTPGSGSVNFQVAGTSYAALSSSDFQFGVPIGGFGSGVPLQFQVATWGISSGTTNTISGTGANAPIQVVTGSVSAATIIKFPSNRTYWILDVSAVTGVGSTNTLTFEVGSATQNVVVQTAGVYVIYTDGSAKTWALGPMTV